ncbi:MAG: NAD(P)/FAD-dependent oxidoreductase [Litorivicinaceae bacterium]
MAKKAGVDCIVIGGGAAGLFCALTAGQRGRKVLVLDSSNKVGKKILMSGGGRCNFTNLHIDPENYISSNPHFVKSALSSYTQWDFIALVEKHGIAYHEKTLGQLFCDKSSKQILEMLLTECEEVGVEILTHCQITSVEQLSDGYSLQTSLGEFACHSLVVATGGLSIPTMGATGFGYELAEQFGLDVLDRSAALVPFTFSDQWKSLCERLAGLSTDVVMASSGQSFREGLLFTHRGLSGPVSLQVSSYWSPGQPITINLMPDCDASEYLLDAKGHHGKSLVRTVLTQLLPKTLVNELEALLWSSYQTMPLAEIPDAVLRKIGSSLSAWTLKPSGTEGYRTAEVTLRGIDTRHISSKTMECSEHRGLYFIGEVVDVTGHLGGYNFQWAWSSGYAAGSVV